MTIDELVTMDGETYQVVAIHGDGDVVIEHVPTGETDTVPSGWVLPA